MIFFALIKLIPITLTLPGIAGLVLTIGVAADSNIVIFERIKEEVRAGRSMSNAIAAGYRRGIATIIDANVVTLLTAFVLFVLATAGVKGFAFVLGIGTIVSLLTAVVFTQALLGSMSRTRLLRSPAPSAPRARACAGTSTSWARAAGSSPSRACILLDRRPRDGDQAAQPRHRLRVRHPGRGRADRSRPTRNGVRETLDGAGVSGGEVQRESNPGLGDNVFLIQSKTLKPSQINKLQKELEGEYGIVANGFNSTSVGPTFGETVANSARNALIFSLLIICAYIAFRFDPKFAVPVLIALFHDILITAGIYSLTGREVTQRNGRRFPHHPRLLALRHDHRLRPNTREHAAHAAGCVLADRQPLDERGADPFAGDQLHDPARGRLAARLRRRHPAGLRLRDDGRDRLRNLLVDLHRLAGADRLEGTRAGLHPPPRADRRDRRQRAGLRRRDRAGQARRAGRGSDAELEEEIAAQEEQAPEGRRSGDGRAGARAMAAAASSNGEPPAVDPTEVAKRERDEKRRRTRRQQRRKHGRNR